MASKDTISREYAVGKALDAAQTDITRALTHLRRLGLTADEAVEFFKCSVELRWHHDVNPVPRALDPLRTLRREPTQTDSAWAKQKKRLLAYMERLIALPTESQEAIQRYDACMWRLIRRLVRARYGEQVDTEPPTTG